VKRTYIVIAHEAFNETFYETLTVEDGQCLETAIEEMLHDLVRNGDYDDGDPYEIYTDLVLRIIDEHQVEDVGVSVMIESREGDHESDS